MGASFYYKVVDVLGFVATFLAVADESDFASGLKASYLALADVEHFAGLLQGKPVAGSFVTQFFKQGAYHVVKVGHALKHGCQNLLVNRYYFDRREI